MKKLADIIAAVPEIAFICIDVANGYSEHFVEYVKQVRRKFPTHTIMVIYLSECKATNQKSNCQLNTWMVF